MKFIPTPLEGAFTIDLETVGDNRGFFARAFCQEEFAKRGLNPNVLQANCSLSREKGTLRGLHYQLPPAEETKLVKCISGAVYDVIVDLRPDSQTFRKFFAEILSSENQKMMYVPQGFAHGFLTLEPNSEVFYMVSASYSKIHERGIRFDDPFFGIDWPFNPKVISERDRSHPDYA